MLGNKIAGQPVGYSRAVSHCHTGRMYFVQSLDLVGTASLPPILFLLATVLTSAAGSLVLTSGSSSSAGAFTELLGVSCRWSDDAGLLTAGPALAKAGSSSHLPGSCQLAGLAT